MCSEEAACSEEDKARDQQKLNRKQSNRRATRQLRARKRVRRVNQINQIRQILELFNAQNAALLAVTDKLREQISALPLTVDYPQRDALMQTACNLEDVRLPSGIIASLFAGLDKLCCTPTIIRKNKRVPRGNA